MKHGFHGGLYGKARRVHMERRALRMYASQCIDEYMEPDSVVRSVRRVIPVIRRATTTSPICDAGQLEAAASRRAQAVQFHPERRTVLRKTPSPATVVRIPQAPQQQQLELALSVEQTTAHQDVADGQERSANARSRPLARPLIQSTKSDPAANANTIDEAHAMQLRRRAADVRKKGEFSIAAFLKGCLIGSAAVIAMWATIVALV